MTLGDVNHVLALRTKAKRAKTRLDSLPQIERDLRDEIALAQIEEVEFLDRFPETATPNPEPLFPA
jgi:hypothetical protein